MCESESSTCPYCGDALTGRQRKKCGKPECKRAFQNDRCRVWQAEYRAKHGVRHSRRTEEGREKRKQERKRWKAANTESVLASWRRDGEKAKARRAVDRAEQQRQRMQLIVHPGPYSMLTAKHPVMRIMLIAKQEQKSRQTRSHKTRKVKPFIGGTCARCGKSFIAEGGAHFKYCSAACLNATCKDNRRAVEHEPYRRFAIFERDGWRCHICGRKARRDVHHNHKLAPTIDHLVPVSQGGRDAADNVACAHRYCNLLKSDRGTTQLLLVG